MTNQLSNDNIASLDWDKVGGLIPAIVQDAETKTVLMLGYVSEESLAATFKSGYVTFFSRSRQELWQKGETSGNGLKLVSIAYDCDKDTLLVRANPEGPTCHLGPDSCFNEDNEPGISFIANLEDIINQRAKDDPDASYTARLLAEGKSRITKKVGEEGVEVALAGLGDDKEHLKDEAADLLYHLLVLLKANEVTLADVSETLRKRHKK